MANIEDKDTATTYLTERGIRGSKARIGPVDSDVMSAMYKCLEAVFATQQYSKLNASFSQPVIVVSSVNCFAIANCFV